MKNKLMPTIVLSSICLVVVLMLSVVNMFTDPIIKEANDKKANETLKVVLPEGEDFEAIAIEDYELPAMVTKAYRETNGKGFVFEMSSSGYKSGLLIMCGIDAEGKVTGSKFTASQETFGAEQKLDNAFNGQTYDTYDALVVSGATKTSGGYSGAIKAALEAFIIIGGGEVDLRDEATIIQDNCNLALGTEGAVFEKWFATEEIGVDALYVSDVGCVALIYDTYIGITPDGTVSTEGIDANSGETVSVGDGAYSFAYSAYLQYSSSNLTEVALPEGVHKNVLAAYKTESGNYVFELQAAGYGIDGEWNKSNEYIKLKVAISSEGKIISTLTTYENESDGIGDVCGTPAYYEQYNGLDAETYKEVPTISGATVTSGGYKKAIERAFAAFELLKGGEVNE